MPPAEKDAMENAPEPRLKTLALFGAFLVLVIVAVIVGAAVLAA